MDFVQLYFLRLLLCLWLLWYHESLWYLFLGVEDDPNTGVYFVGRGCCPNEDGIVQLDAGIMRGSDCSLGAVCALEG